MLGTDTLSVAMPLLPRVPPADQRAEPAVYVVAQDDGYAVCAPARLRVVGRSYVPKHNEGDAERGNHA